MADGDIAWREYNIHDNCNEGTNDQTQDEEDTHQPVDIFAPREEDVYEIHKYNFDIENENVTIKLREQSDYDVSTGSCVWKGAEILCQYLTKHPDLIREKQILELGAGVGLCGIVSAKVIGASHVLLTDGDHTVLRNLRYNVELNELGTKVSCPQLIWGKTKAKDFEKEYGKQDVILATDCVYVTKSVRPLFETIESLLAPNGIFIFVNSCASICPLEDVVNIGKEFGFVASSDELWYQPGSEKDPVYVFRR